MTPQSWDLEVKYLNSKDLRSKVVNVDEKAGKSLVLETRERDISRQLEGPLGDLVDESRQSPVWKLCRKGLPAMYGSL